MSQITAATINLRNRTARWLERRHALVAQLVDTAPDLISLQEISLPIAQGRWLRNQINARLGGELPYRLVQQRRRHLIHGYFEGIGILTRLPVVYHRALSLGYGGRVALRANIELPNKRTLDFVSVHLHNPSYAHEARQEQVMKLIGWLQSFRPNPFQVIAGDFNEVPDGLAIEFMKQGCRSAYEVTYGRDPLATFPTALVKRSDGWAGCLDYIFVSPAIQVEK
ncbi:MAG: endonuclease/exonuclease/phosphatase family protein, partial [Anaerolineae bacterium]